MATVGFKGLTGSLHSINRITSIRLL